MDWVVKAANEQNARRVRREAIVRGAPALWQNVCEAIGQAVRAYSEQQLQLIEFSGPANHTVWVAVFEGNRQEKGNERERVTIVFNQEMLAVEVSSYLNRTPKLFQIGLNAKGYACLMDGAKEISVEEFTEIALRNALFPDGI